MTVRTSESVSSEDVAPVDAFTSSTVAALPEVIARRKDKMPQNFPGDDFHSLKYYVGITELQKKISFPKHNTDLLVQNHNMQPLVHGDIIQGCYNLSHELPCQNPLT